MKSDGLLRFWVGLFFVSLMLWVILAISQVFQSEYSHDARLILQIQTVAGVLTGAAFAAIVVVVLVAAFDRLRTPGAPIREAGDGARPVS